MRMITLQVLVLCLTALQFVNGQDPFVDGAICVESTNADTSFQVVFRLDRLGDTTVTGLTSYASDESPYYRTPVPGPGCATTTLVNDIYTLTFTVDTTRPGPPTGFPLTQDYQCGVSELTTTTYEVAIRLAGVGSPDVIYTFVCDTNNLQPIMVNDIGLSSGHVQDEGRFDFTFNDPTLALYVIRPNGNIHVNSVTIGTPIQLRLTYLNNNMGGGFGEGNELASYGQNLFGYSYHVATVPLTGGSITIQVSTLSTTGTSVRITGELAGQAIDMTMTVTRAMAWELTIDPSYFPTSTDINWLVETKSLKIVATPDPVGVKVLIAAGTDRFAAYIAYPDTLLGTEYRVIDYTYPDGQIVIIGAVDGTTVTLDLTAFDAAEKGTVTIDGQSAAGLNTVTVALDEYETLHLHCDDCSKIGITSDQDIAVINGGFLPSAVSMKEGYTMNQISAIKYLDTDFVQLPKDTTNEKLVFYSTAEIGQVGTYTNDVATGVAFTDEFTYATNTVGVQLQSTVPLYAYTTVDQSNYQSYVMLPGLRQWTTHHYFYLTPGYDYNVKIVAMVGQTQLIEEITSGGTTVLTGATGGQIDDINPLLGVANPLYEIYDYDITPVTADMYEWRATTPYRKFLVTVTQRLEQGGDTVGAGLLSFGTAFPCINPCVPGPAGQGNGIDDDCDGLIDEGLPGIDNDLDMLIDEDNGGFPTTLGLASTVRVKTLYSSDNMAFTDPNVKQLHLDGCNTNNVLSAHAQVEPFKYSTALQATNPALWVMDTNVFRAYRFNQVSTVYYRAEVEFCYGGKDFCKLDSCTTGRKKRSEDQNGVGHIETRTVEGKVRVTRPEKESGRSRASCSQVGLYWAPHVLLVLIVFCEALLIALMLYRNTHLKRV